MRSSAINCESIFCSASERIPFSRISASICASAAGAMSAAAVCAEGGWPGLAARRGFDEGVAAAITKAMAEYSCRRELLRIDRFSRVRDRMGAMTERSGELKTSRRQASGWCCGVGRKPKSHLFGRLFTPPAQTSQDQWVFHATTTRLLDPVCGDMNYRKASVRRLIATNEGLDVTAQTCTACTKYILARARAAARRARRSIGSCGQRGRRNDCGVAEDGMG